MNKHLVYVDQNIVGLLVERKLHMPRFPEICWVYSKEHFAEIRRSSDPKQYLSALEDMDAKLLDLELNARLKISGTAKLMQDGSPLHHYNSYIESTSGFGDYQNLFDPFVAWVNGGSDEGPFRELPATLAAAFFNLTKDLPSQQGFIARLDSITTGFAAMIEEMLKTGNDIIKTRKAFGDGKGAIGSISGQNQLLKIWEIVRPSCPGMSLDQFFGFDPIEKEGYDEWPIYLGIIGCCSVMDILGFQAERKCRKLQKVPNVMSDAKHIANGAFCTAILSQDKRLICRARAIYEYKGIASVPLLIGDGENVGR
ncbi:hypothetical protein LPW11_13275 [Geomonas sp. RF6]|uniref:hypothetical protein n=1 Tax=Geomonas sp. RF6 TaxID=2897342 RepID=UPI001E45BE87|nr:hypothetical protein [Geomonas sp. RF6]UFS68867.1 hypothetical protein LPW11_13275 [Geomonas sp. RF6]